MNIDRAAVDLLPAACTGMHGRGMGDLPAPHITTNREPRRGHPAIMCVSRRGSRRVGVLLARHLGPPR